MMFFSKSMKKDSTSKQALIDPMLRIQEGLRTSVHDAEKELEFLQEYLTEAKSRWSLLDNTITENEDGIYLIKKGVKRVTTSARNDYTDEEINAAYSECKEMYNNLYKTRDDVPPFWQAKDQLELLHKIDPDVCDKVKEFYYMIEGEKVVEIPHDYGMSTEIAIAQYENLKHKRETLESTIKEINDKISSFQKSIEEANNQIEEINNMMLNKRLEEEKHRTLRSSTITTFSTEEELKFMKTTQTIRELSYQVKGYSEINNG